MEFHARRGGLGEEGGQWLELGRVRRARVKVNENKAGRGKRCEGKGGEGGQGLVGGG